MGTESLEKNNFVLPGRCYDSFVFNSPSRPQDQEMHREKMEGGDQEEGPSSAADSWREFAYWARHNNLVRDSLITKKKCLKKKHSMFHLKDDDSKTRVRDHYLSLSLPGRASLLYRIVSNKKIPSV